MSDNRVSSQSTSLINELKSSIESRKHTITNYKKFINGFKANSENITINQAEYNNLLEDFEYTIIQSLQAIKSLEIENLNYREIIDELRKENKLYNAYRNPFDEHRNNFILTEKEELSNYRITSPSFLANMNFDYNAEKYPEMTFSNEFQEKEDAQNLREVKTNEEKSNLCHPYDTNSNHFSTRKENVSYRDEQDPEYFYKKISYKYENEDINEQMINDCEPSRNIYCAEEFKLNFDYSQIKDYDKFLTAASDLKKIKYINYTNNDNKYNSFDTADKQDEKHNNSYYENLPLFYDSNYDKKDNANLDENTSLSKKEINDNENDNFNSYTKDITIKEGLRNKIKNKSNSMKNSLKQIEISDNSNLNHVIEEDKIQLLSSNKTSFENKRFDYSDKISIFNLINKINSDERLIEYFAYEYGDGKYEKFLNRLEKEQLDTNEIEKIIKYFTDTKQTKSGKLHSNDSSKNNLNMTDDSKLKRSRSNRNFKNKQNESIDSRNSKRNNSSQREYKNDVYIEPIRLENLLRSGKPDQKRLHQNLKFSISKSIENTKNETIRILKNAYAIIQKF